MDGAAEKRGAQAAEEVLKAGRKLLTVACGLLTCFHQSPIDNKKLRTYKSGPRYACYLMGMLPHATYSGFTGTPIDKTACVVSVILGGKIAHGESGYCLPSNPLPH